MKNVKRLVAFAVVIAMVIAFAPADSGVVLAAKTTKTVKTVKKFKATKNMTFTDKNVKDLSKALKSKKVKTITLKLKKTKKVTIPKGDYSTKKLVVNAPKTSVVNKATFDTIRIDSIAPDTWTEKGNGNSIFVLSDKSVHIKVDTNRRVASILFGEEAKANAQGVSDTKNNNVKHFVEMINGALSRLVDATKNEIVMKASGDSSVGSIDVEAAGANMTLSATGDAHIHNMDLSESAGSPETKVGVTVGGNATVDNLKTSAEGATLDVATSDSGAVGLKIVGGGSATLTGTSTRQSVVDVSEADPAKGNVTIENNNAKLETSQNQDVSTIVENKTGKELDKQVKSDSTTTSSDKPAEGTGKKPGQGGSSGGGAGGGAGGGYSGGGSSVSIPADPGNLIRDAGFASGNYQGYWEGNILADFGAAGNAALGGGKAVFTVTNPGTTDYAVQLCQKNITLKHGAKYKLTGKITSDKAKSIGIAFMDPNQSYLWYGGTDADLNAGEIYNIDLPFTVDKAKVGEEYVTCETSNTIQFAISMGNKGTTPDSYTITVSDLRLEMVEDAPEVDTSSETQVPTGYKRTSTSYNSDIGGDVIDENLVNYCSDLTAGTKSLAGGKMKINLSINKVEGTTEEKQPRVTVIVFSDGWAKNHEITVPSVTTGEGTYEIEYDFDDFYTKAGENNHPKYYNLRLWEEGLTYTYKITSVTLEGVTATSGSSTTPSTNLLSNGNFTVKDVWYIGTGGMTVESASTWDVSEGIAEVDVNSFNSTDTGGGSVQFCQGGLNLVQGKKYKLTFKAKAENARRIKVALMEEEHWGWYGGNDNIALTTSFNDYEVSMDPAATSSSKGVLQFNLGRFDEVTSLGKVYISDVELVEVTE